MTVPRPEPGGDAGRSRPALWLIGAVVASALGLRFVYLVDYQSSPLFATAAGPDVTEYYEWALAILAGQWLWAETPFHAPLYAYFLAGLYAVTGQTLAAVRFGQLLLGLTALALLSFSTGRRLGWRIGIATAALWALYVPVVYYEAELFAEGLAVFLNSCVLALLLGSERPRRRRCVVAGLLLGASAITHPLSLFFALFLLVGLSLSAWRAGDKRAAAVNPALAAAGIAILILPVALYNTKLSGALVPIQRHNGLNFYIGNNANADGTPNVRFGPEWDRLTALPHTEAGILGSAGRDAFYYKKAMAFIRESPGAWARLLGRKLALTLSAREVTASAPMASLRPDIALLRLPQVAFALILSLAVVGLTLGRGYRLLPVVALVAGYLLGQVIFVTAGRYRAPMLPGMFVLGGIGLSVLFDMIGARDRRRLVVATVAMAAALVVAFLPVVPAHNEDQAEAALARAFAYYNGGEVGRAVAELEPVVEARPDALGARVSLGLMLEALGDRRKASEHYRRVLAADSDYAYAHLRLGDALREEGRLQTALHHFGRAVEIDPEYREAREALAALLQSLDRYREAALHWRHLLTRRFEAPIAASFCESLLGVGAYESARQLLEESLARAPQDVDLRLRLARLRAACPNPELRDPKAAIQLAQGTAGLTGPGEARSADILAMAYAAGGRFQEATDLADQAARLAAQAGDADLREAVLARRALYQKGLPFIDQRP